MTSPPGVPYCSRCMRRLEPDEPGHPRRSLEPIYGLLREPPCLCPRIGSDGTPILAFDDRDMHEAGEALTGLLRTAAAPLLEFLGWTRKGRRPRRGP